MDPVKVSQNICPNVGQYLRKARLAGSKNPLENHLVSSVENDRFFNR